MSATTKINWTDASLALVTGCSPAGVGCAHCYARRMWPRLQMMAAPKYGGREFGEVRFHPEELERPRSWKRPRAIFISPMGDLFHEAVTYMDLLKVIGMWESCRQHTFIVLTKRALPMRSFFANYMPPPNVVLGVSCSTQEEVNEIVPHLLSTNAQRRVVSLEPLVGPVSLDGFLISCRDFGARGMRMCGDCKGSDREAVLDGVIVGGETGPGARPMHPDWVRDLRDECVAANTPFFFKQWGTWLPGECVGPTHTRHKCVNLWAGEWEECSDDWETEQDYGPIMYHAPRSAGQRWLDGKTHDALCWDVRGKGEA